MDSKKISFDVAQVITIISTIITVSAALYISNVTVSHDERHDNISRQAQIHDERAKALDRFVQQYATAVEIVRQQGRAARACADFMSKGKEYSGNRFPPYIDETTAKRWYDWLYFQHLERPTITSIYLTTKVYFPKEVLLLESLDKKARDYIDSDDKKTATTRDAYGLGFFNVVNAMKLDLDSSEPTK